uniref:Uncharacterized protein n=1 Tax=Knipowitschia caucasica TaxID=637954 RepID=A0AAV2L223_KNICA
MYGSSTSAPARRLQHPYALRPGARLGGTLHGHLPLCIRPPALVGFSVPLVSSIISAPPPGIIRSPQ